ncbi:hypothetical protein CRYUN_Cryun17cG0070700 [Craigia yunnanensis]
MELATMKNTGKSYHQNPNIPTSIKSDRKDVEAFLNSFPAGYRFKPRDEELVLHYLKPKLFNKPLPPNKIMEVQLYHYNPEILVGNKSYGEGEWYFFTPRDKKYRNGSRPRRAAGDGYWKATGADRNLKYNGVDVGYRKALVFYRGKPPKGQKSDWMMHEYRLKDPPTRSNASIDDMRLDDWVLCKIYKKTDKSMKTSNGQQAVGIENQELDSATIPLQLLGHVLVEEPNNTSPQQGFVPFHFGSQLGQLEEHVTLNGLPTSPKSYYDAMMLEQNSTLFLDNVSDYYDHSLMPMTEELAALPSSIPPFRSMDNLDQFINIDKLSSVSQFNFDLSSQFIDHQSP